MINMGPRFAVKSNTFVLFSTILVYSLAWGQSADDLYNQVKQNPNMTKEQLDQAKVEALDRARMQKLNDLNAAEQKEAEAYNKKLASEPKEPDGPEDDREEPSGQSPDAKPKSVAAGSSGTGRGTVESSPSSSDSPKVAFDPMPDEIHFDGDDSTGASPSPSPASKIARPPKRKIH